MKKSLFAILAIICIAAISTSCKKKKTVAGIVRTWSAVVKAQFENPAPAGRNESGTVNITLYDDNTVKWSASIQNFAAGDPITLGHIHSGDAITNGPVLVNLSPVFTPGSGVVASMEGSGTVTITPALADSLLNKPIYVNFHTAAFPGGITRAQLDKTIDVAFDVNLTGAAENPAVVTTATGRALLRLTTDKILYYSVTVTNVEVADALTVSHIHRAAVGVNGPVFINLIVPADATAFGKARSLVLDDTQILSLKNDAVYVNAHSVLRPGGLVRGQIR